MRFTGVRQGQLHFVRVRELVPEEQLSPDRSQVMRIDPAWVSSILAYGRPVWPD